MADTRTVTLELVVDGKGAVTGVRSVDGELVRLRTSTDEAGRSVSGLGGEFDKLTRQINKLAGQQADLTAEQHAELAELVKQRVEISTQIDARKRLVSEIEKQAGAEDKAADSGKKLGGILDFAVGSLIAGMVQRLAGKFIDLGRAAVQITSDFQSAVADLGAITGVGGEQLDRLAESAKTLDRNFRPVEVVNGFKLMASAKSDLIPIPGALEAATKAAMLLSRATGDDLEQSVRAVAKTLNQFGLGAEQAGRVVNVLAAGSKLGAAEVPLLADSLEKVGGVASNVAKIGIEQTVAALETLSLSGLEGAEAGTKLASTLTKLENQSDRRLKPSVVGLTTAIENLNAKHLDSNQITKLVGSENLNVISVLQAGVVTMRNFEAGVTGTNTAQEQAAARAKTLEAANHRLAATTDRLALSVGSDASPALAGMVDEFDRLIQRRGVHDFLQGAAVLAVGLAKMIEKVIVAIVGTIEVATDAVVIIASLAVAATKAQVALLKGDLAGAQAAAVEGINRTKTAWGQLKADYHDTWSELAGLTRSTNDQTDALGEATAAAVIAAAQAKADADAAAAAAKGKDVLREKVQTLDAAIANTASTDEAKLRRLMAERAETQALIDAHDQLISRIETERLMSWRTLDPVGGAGTISTADARQKARDKKIGGYTDGIRRLPDSMDRLVDGQDAKIGGDLVKAGEDGQKQLDKMTAAAVKWGTTFGDQISQVVKALGQLNAELGTEQDALKAAERRAASATGADKAAAEQEALRHKERIRQIEEQKKAARVAALSAFDGIVLEALAKIAAKIIGSNPTPLGIAAAAAMVATGKVLFDKIKSTVAGFESGGYIGGGEQLIRVNERGREFVANAGATKRFGPLLEAMNSGIDPRSLSAGTGGGGTMRVEVRLTGELTGRGTELQAVLDKSLSQQVKLGGA